MYIDGLERRLFPTHVLHTSPAHLMLRALLDFRFPQRSSLPPPRDAPPGASGTRPSIGRLPKRHHLNFMRTPPSTAIQSRTGHGTFSSSRSPPAPRAARAPVDASRLASLLCPYAGEVRHVPVRRGDLFLTRPPVRLKLQARDWSARTPRTPARVRRPRGSRFPWSATAFASRPAARDLPAVALRGRAVRRGHGEARRSWRSKASVQTSSPATPRTAHADRRASARIERPAHRAGRGSSHHGSRRGRRGGAHPTRLSARVDARSR